MSLCGFAAASIRRFQWEKHLPVRLNLRTAPQRRAPNAPDQQAVRKGCFRRISARCCLDAPFFRVAGTFSPATLQIHDKCPGISRDAALIHRGFSLFLRRTAPVTFSPEKKTMANQLHARDAQSASLSSFDGKGRIDLSETDLPLEKEHVQAIQALSEKLGVGMKDVAKVYKAEFEKLAAGARVTNFLIVLALNRTRSILGSAHRGQLAQ
jgi:hypothetical protein